MPDCPVQQQPQPVCPKTPENKGTKKECPGAPLRPGRPGTQEYEQSQSEPDSTLSDTTLNDKFTAVSN